MSDIRKNKGKETAKAENKRNKTINKNIEAGMCLLYYVQKINRNSFNPATSKTL